MYHVYMLRILVSCLLITCIISINGGVLAKQSTTTIVLQSYVGKAPPDAAEYMAQFIGHLQPATVSYGSPLGQLIDRSLSVAPQPSVTTAAIRRQCEQGRNAFVEGQYKEAVQYLQDLRAKMYRRPSLFANDNTLRAELHDALLFLAHTYLRLGQEHRSEAIIADILRTFPEQHLSRVRHGPPLVDAYERVKKRLSRRHRVTLKVTTDTKRSVVFVNERRIGKAPVSVAALYPGRYRIYVESADSKGRVHFVELRRGVKRIHIDVDFDARIQTREFVGLLFQTTEQQRIHEQTMASRIARAVGADRVIIIRYIYRQNPKIYQGRIVNAHTGKEIRSAGIRMASKPPQDHQFRALARYLERGSSPAESVLLRQSTASLDGEPPSGFRPSAVYAWSSLSIGTAGLAAGIPLILLHGRGTCNGKSNCPQDYNTKTLGIALTAAGGVAMAASAVLFWLRYRRPASSIRGQLAWMPWVRHQAAGIVGWVSY